MLKKIEFTLSFDEDLHAYLNKNYSKFKEFRILSESLDARGAPRGRKPKIHYIIEASEKQEDYPKPESLPQFKDLSSKPLIIGAGPAGLFCAIRLAEQGISSIVIERGVSADKRMLNIARFWRYGEMDEETNVCYGEGGAGLFSDGKLITRIKSDLVSYVMNKFVDFGAPADTAYTSNPHLGSNKIRSIITQISKWLISKGTEIIYHDKVDELLYEEKKVVGVKLHSGKKLYSQHIVLGTGHSAADIYQHLVENQVSMKRKDFAVGVRIEHGRKYLDQIQYGEYCAHEKLGAARYRVSYHDHSVDRGVYSFCMCPGGYVLSSGTEKNGIVVNGMSNFARNSPWSNAALVVSVKSDVDLKEPDLLAGLRFQHDIEQKAYDLSKKWATGRELPAMTMGEFLKGRLNSISLPKTSSPSQVVKADFRGIFPQFVNEELKKGLEHFNQQIPGFITDQALLIAPETRTSSPLTILRDKESFVSLSHDQLYPCGEGAGYAGGITSAAVDGVKVALSIMKREKLLPMSLKIS
jgi:uncharacterized FAD-dependent dehydrogenase